ncbi:cell wall hydrolase [Alkaliphilus serpentinus]|uniref:Cell wall hydrolase n=1 Tax=Alkaliphilus serpentinus TaxID=1482731 RepID=A0A833HP14_9FIRM|nr:cell wall hydrolase [Alkaliphilus serpentinus]KAB3530261.1 cell wall hydrolase [Alkaliphilus serpentinus]
MGMIAVGAVVLNRVGSGEFPNRIEEVILQPKQFSSVDDGQFQLEPNEVAYKAAFKALMGNDPTKGCLFFYNPQIATAGWSFNRETVVVIGDHHFTK